MIISYLFQGKSLRVILGIALVILIIGGFIVMNRGGSYHVSIGIEGDSYRDRSLSVDSDYLTEPGERDGIRYREFTSGFSDAYLRLRTQLHDDDEIAVSSLMKSDDDIFLNIDCLDCKNKGLYDESLTINSDFFYHTISDYKRIAEFNGVEVYGKRGLGRKWTDSSTLRQWLSLNMQPHDTVGVWGDVARDDSMVFPQKDHDQSMRKIEVYTRGGFESLVYLRDKAIIEIGKRDLNWYDGADEVRITLSDDRGYLLYRGVMNDDGFETGKKGEEKSHTISLDIRKEGLYTLSIQEVSHNETYYNDFEITTLRMNTNKFMFSGEVMFQYATNISYNAPQEIAFSFFGWTAGNFQSLKIDNDRMIARVGAKDLNMWRDVSLPAGSHVIQLERGLRVRGGKGMYFSVDPHLIFKPYRVDSVTLDSPDILITNILFTSEGDGWYWVTKYYKAHDVLARWRHSPPLIHTIRLRLISPRNEEITRRRSYRLEQGLSEEQLSEVLLSGWRVLID